MRPIIRPGLQVLRRDLRTVQLGREWPGVACLVDSPALRAVLGALDGFRDATAVVLTAAAAGIQVDECSAALDALVEVGAVVDQSATRRENCPEPLWSSLWLMAGTRSTAGEVLGRRRAQQVHVQGAGAVAEAVRQILPRGQVALTEHLSEASLVVVTDECEPDRGRSDAVIRTGVAHVWAYLRDLVGVVGPFVEPGASACLRCVDAGRAEHDPAWPITVSCPRPVVPACDPVLGSAVGALVAHEVAVWASGRRPQTIDAVIELPFGAGALGRRHHPPHPQCGCGWATWQDRMGA